MASWIGFDFDGTLRSMTTGEPVPKILEKVKAYLDQGIECRILTARVATKYPVSHIESTKQFITAWCVEHVGRALPITSEKDYDMAVLYDDRAIAVQTDTGECKGWLVNLEITK